MLDHFPRPPGDNGRGVHWTHSQYFWGKENWGFWKEQLQAMNIKWVKLLDDGGGSAEGLIKRLVDIGIMPVIRFYIEEPNPGHISAREVDTAKRYIDMGAVYFETNNEPDLALEWKGRRRPENWLDIVVDNFIIEADMIRGAGGYLLFPAFGPGGRGNPFEMIVQRGRRDILDGNCALAIHNYCLARPLDYPNDPINLQGAPTTFEEWEAVGGMWAWEMGYEQVNKFRREFANPNASIMEDSTCFRAFEYFDALVNEAVGHSIPIMTTEGGYNVGQRAGTTEGDDPRYPKPTPDRTSRLTDDMFRYIEEDGPDYYFSCMPWLVAVGRMGIWGDAPENQGPWFTHHFDKQFGLNGELPLVQMLKDRPGKVRAEGPVPEGFKVFSTGPDLSDRDFDDRLKYLQPQILLEPVTDSNQPYWRLNAVRWENDQEGGKGYIFVKALDQDGNPIEAAKFQADRGDTIDVIETKGPWDQYFGNYLMTAGLGTYKVSMAQDNLPSDILTNIGLGNEVSPKDLVRVSFYLTFQLVNQEETLRPITPDPNETTESTPDPDLPSLSERVLDERFQTLQPMVLLEPVTDPTQPHWRLVNARWADKFEANGKAYIFVKALDEAGEPLEGMIFQADRGDAIDKVETKGPWDQYFGNYGLVGALGTYKVSMAQGNLPSDRLINIGYGDGVEPSSTSFYLTFQRVAGGQPTPPNNDTSTDVDKTPDEGTSDNPDVIVSPSPEPDDSEAPDEPPVIDPVEAFRKALLLAAGEYIIPVNRQSLLYQYAQQNNLGHFCSAEFSFEHQTVIYRAQVFEQGIAYYTMADPDVIDHISYNLPSISIQPSGTSQPASAAISARENRTEAQDTQSHKTEEDHLLDWIKGLLGLN
ncbi:MAG: hypothetical protein AAF485_12730 [Chloroflexota bacterium]